MSAPVSGKRPLSYIAQEAETNGRFVKRRPLKRDANPNVTVAALQASSSSPSTSLLPSLYRQNQTVFRILCPASRTGSIIGKSGGIIKSIREDTGATIRIEDAVMGCDERVVTICAKEEGFKPQKFKGPGNYQEDEGEEVMEAMKGVDGRNERDENGAKADFLPDNDGDGQERDVGQNQATGDGADIPDIGDGDLNKSNSGKSGAKDSGLAPVQEALMRVHLRIMESEPSKPEGSTQPEGGGGDRATRLLVPTTQVGCLLGKGGKIISQIRQDSGAQIRVLPRDQLPLCAVLGDEVVQITGNMTAIRKALMAVSTQLRNNPPKKQNEEPLNIGAPLPPHSLDPFFAGNMIPSNASLGMPLSPRVPMDQSPAIHLSHETEDITFRILCPKENIGSIIGKGGHIIQSIREETGAKISIDVSSDTGDLRVIRVTAPESPEDAFSKTQKAVMIIHTKLATLDVEKDGQHTTKLLVPSDQAGCLLGRGGYIMTEMRKLTHARIQIHGREHLPPCAHDKDEIVEIAGNFASAKDALIQVTTRLRNNMFKAKFGPPYTETKPPCLSAFSSQTKAPFSLRSQMFSVPSSHDRYLPYSDVTVGIQGQQPHGSWSSQVKSYGMDHHTPLYNDHVGMVHNHDFPVDSTRSHSTFISSHTVEVIVPEHAIGSIVGESGSNMQQICKISGARVKLRGLTPGATERIVEITGTPDQTHAAQSLLQAFVLSGQ